MNTSAGLTFYENANAPVSNPLSLDGLASGSIRNSNPLRVSLTTTNSNDLIYLMVSILNSGSQTVSSVTDGNSLSWKARGAVSLGTTVRVETWYATSSSALVSDGITVTLSSAAYFTVIAFGISGANLSNPFDSGVSTPVSATGMSSTPSVKISTLNADDLIVGAVAYNTAGSATAAAGFTLIANPKARNVAGSGEYSLTLSPQNNLNVNFSITSASWAILADAVVAPITADTSLSIPGTPGTYTVNQGQAVYLFSPQYTAATKIYSGNWLTDIFASATTSSALEVSIYTTDSLGAVISTVLQSGTTSNVGTVVTEVKNLFSGANGTIPANGYIEVVIWDPSSASVIYWGTGQLTNFETPNTYNYVLKINNPSSTPFLINLAVASSSGTSRLNNLTIWIQSPLSKQISLGASVTTQTSGPQITIPASTTMFIAIFATASSAGSTTVVLSLKVQSSSAPVYAQYTIGLGVL